tara:strand:+ start:88 stop:402 length:315 start_codon:yes stop_codon:yes gene_type:complete
VSEEESPTERLMNTLITKMEAMDSELRQLRRDVSSPQAMLRKAGFVPISTPLSEDVMPDDFRGDEILKENKDIPDNYTNEEIHTMSWEEIHDMAAQHKEVKEMY